ncbi:Peroxiredoxin [Halalkaliarchaeum sp. AArc-CO]|uniref:thioredoxin-dependent thiol peroxidase n=1 Tax=Halalkaliarchaeum sp. AArc-CO TaxID=2866381 RepID=UPI00217D4039|nr:thioredoxin-dependent thiol peroxidase [Halalkaliarchaeum sp. AArc-CO]UWG52279.1 Peroxiredoxin [Halalkaliarchaeum sp. AArc-CO]
MLETGEDAPDFTLQNQDDEPVTLSDIDAEYTVVYFYPRADTPGCTTEACGFRDEWGAFSDAGVAVVGISDDPVEDLADFAEKYDLPFDLLSDPDGEVASAYDSYGEKNVFGNTVDGVFRNTYVVDAGSEIVLAYEGVSPEDHAEEILADLESL